MAGKFSLTAVAAFMLVAGAFAQCPNNGVGVGQEELCNISGKGTVCGEIQGFITSPGTWDIVDSKADNGQSNMECGDYSNGGVVNCDGNTVTSVLVGGTTLQCSSANIVQGGGFGSFAVIANCCS